MKAFLFATVLLAAFTGVSCEWYSEPAYPSLLNNENGKRLVRELSNCDLVFIGTVRSLENGWFGPTGSLAPSYQRVRYEVNELIRGEELGDDEFELAYMIFGGQPAEVQRGDGGPYRLDSNYYRRGSRFIVLAGKPEYEKFYVECSSWKATENNLERLQLLLDRAAKESRE